MPIPRQQHGRHVSGDSPGGLAEEAFSFGPGLASMPDELGNPSFPPACTPEVGSVVTAASLQAVAAWCISGVQGSAGFVGLPQPSPSARQGELTCGHGLHHHADLWLLARQAAGSCLACSQLNCTLLCMPAACSCPKGRSSQSSIPASTRGSCRPGCRGLMQVCVRRSASPRWT